MSEPKPRHFVPVPRAKYVGVMHLLHDNIERQYWTDPLHRAELADRINELFSMADDPGPGAIPMDETDLKGLALDIRGMTNGFSPPQIASIIASDIDPDWEDS